MCVSFLNSFNGSKSASSARLLSVSTTVSRLGIFFAKFGAMCATLFLAR